MDTHPGVVEELKKGWTEDSPYLGKGKHYPDFLKFFQDEIEAKGWEKVLLEYVFKEDERSEAIFGRLFAGAYLSIHLYRFEKWKSYCFQRIG